MHRQATNMSGAISILRNIRNYPCFIFFVGAGLPANLPTPGILSGAISILRNISNDPCFILVGAGLPANCISRQVRGHAHRAASRRKRLTFSPLLQFFIHYNVLFANSSICSAVEMALEFIS
jgi:hypothetical protein